MKQSEKPLVLTVDEFIKHRRLGTQPVIIYYTQKQFERAIRGMKPVMADDLSGPGLYLFPMPGVPGYVAFPICGPHEVPVVRPDGSVYCVYSEFEDTEEAPPEEVPLKLGCSLTIGPYGIPRCAGKCPEGGKCRSSYSITSGGFLFRCGCPTRLSRVIAKPFG